MTQPTNQTVLSPEIWLRALFMIGFAIVNYLLRWVICGIAIVQFIIVLVRGEPHDKLVNFSHSLSTFSYQILLFLTFSSDEKPFPFSDWPELEKGAKQDHDKKDNEDESI